ncbi:MAG TPA: sigma 54-dependent Fis family transcriptional regulator [Kofleriaceae bacterium]|jgi:DNA-binding NtrC family response regulator|nr:sigma 54-dependent Fis family transcriptional regulator [Kofleriaceae bacterium]
MTRDRTNVTALLEDLPSFSRQNRGGIFLVIKGPDRGESVRLGEGKAVSFGSSPSCDMVLTDKTVSRKHMQAELTGDEVIVSDTGSTNGTFIQGSRFERIAVGFGAEVKLGRTVVKFLPDEEVLDPEPSQEAAFGSIVGADPKMRQLFKLMTDVAQTNATVLIEGETGTGKELIAEEVHNHSPRKDGPFIVFDCGSVPRELIESMLFGHVKGSFTGAITDRKGAFAEAHGGTIFLDEIGEMALDLQPSLLRVLDKRAVRKVGSNTYEKIDVRVVAATNRDLRAEVAKKAFREDLYYRLAVIRVSVPPLRERGSDIPILTQHFINSFSGSLGVAPDDMARLQRHSWPGNVRELRNVIERACLLSTGSTINIEDALVEQAPAGLGIRTDLPFKEAKGQLVEMFEREYIEDLMRRHGGNLSAAAREAQIDRKHLRELIRKYDLDPRQKLDEDAGGDDD